MKLQTKWLTDKSVQRLFAAFQNADHQIYFVGGCVRNALLDVPVFDLDISTSATPEQTDQIAKDAGFKTIPTGIEHGTITVVNGSQVFEITSFRKDVETHGRRAVVEFSTNITDDALRRDFTMNALYADIDGSILDPLNGIDDLRSRKVRFIANADDRIKEDYLRILRYFRFHTWYGDQTKGMDTDALAAIAANVEGLTLISKERIGIEMQKILSAPDPVQTISSMEACGVLMRVLMGSSARWLGPMILLETQLGLPVDWQRRLIALAGEDPVPHLRLSKAVEKRLKLFAKAQDANDNLSETAYRFGPETALDVALMTAASLQTPVSNNAMEQIELGTNATFPITAKDLPPELTGRSIGEALRELETEWVASGFSKTKADLLS